MTMLPTTGSFPRSFRDPMYDLLAQAAEGRYGLPSGILSAIRNRGERSNADQVSSAGARTPYQFIPTTRQGFIKQYGIDPWKDPQSATDAAAIHIRDDYKRTGSWDEAVARYHGGMRPGPKSRRYASRVGNFDEGQAMPPSLFPVPYYGGTDPLAPVPQQLAPEPMKTVAPVPGDPGPSATMTATAPVAARKRGGILGALESVFMPEPDSRWASALRNGIFDAKAGQVAYKNAQYDAGLKTMEAEAKLKNLLTKGEYQVVGNNVFHIKPDGSTEMISPPQTKGDKMQLLDKWQTMQEGDPAKALIERMLLGGNDDDVLAAKAAAAAEAARIRAGATTGAAQIRANAAPKKTTELPPLPPGFTVVK